MRLLPFLLALALSLPAADKPNIIVILSDDAGYADFSVHGSRQFPTPRIDSIAANGIRFTNGYVSGAVCSPTRAGLMTGRYQQHFGHEFNIPPVYSETNGLPLTETTIADYLKGGGYHTVALGKWHLGYAPDFHPLARGFDEYYGFLQGARSYWPLEKGTQLNQLLKDRTPVPETFSYMSDALGEQAAHYIGENKERAFFLYLAFNAVHTPMHATEDDLAKADASLDGKRRTLAAMTAGLDRGVGFVLDALEKHKLTDNTLLFFLNDNGGATSNNSSNTPLRGHKGTTWEGGIRVPFLVQWPARLPKGQTVDEPVIALDILPTALAAAGIQPELKKPLDGTNLLPFLLGEAKEPPHESLFWKNGARWAVRQGPWKLVSMEAETPQPMLFHLVDDISESTDLAAKNPEIVKRLSQAYETWAAKVIPTPWGGRGDKEDEEETDTPPKKPGRKNPKPAGGK